MKAKTRPVDYKYTKYLMIFEPSQGNFFDGELTQSETTAPDHTPFSFSQYYFHQHLSPNMPFYYKSHNKAAPNSFVSVARRIYNPLGFQKGYNFPLWVIFAGAALGFCASRAMYLDFDGKYKNTKWVTGDWEFQQSGRWRVGMLMHLACVVPIGFLLPWQFLPVIRRKAILFHRLNGYLLMTLLVVGNVGGLMICDKSLGGSLDVRMMIGYLAIVTTGSLIMAYINIKRLQIDQHRAWMLRAWFYAFIPITQRLIQLAMVDIITEKHQLYVPMACHTVEHILSLIQPGLSTMFYPQCEGNPDMKVAVLGNAHPQPTPEGIPRLHEIGASIHLTFSSTIVLSFLIHAFGVEVYLRLTQAEANRLKRVSYERQLAKGWIHPGDASWLTSETWGDMDEFDYVKRKPEVEDANKAEPVLSMESGSGSGSGSVSK